MKFFAKRKLNKQLEQLSERSVINPKIIKRLIFIHDVDLDITESQFEEFCAIFSSSYDLIEYVIMLKTKKCLRENLGLTCMEKVLIGMEDLLTTN